MADAKPRDEFRRESCPERLRGPLERCARGELPPNVALMRLLALRRIWKANPQAWSVVKAALDGVEHGGAAATPEEGVAHWAALFDRAAAVSPEASVAPYPLGSAELLDAATDEIVRRMRAWGLLGPGRAVLDIGCGIGRLAAALAPEVGQVTGI